MMSVLEKYHTHYDTVGHITELKKKIVATLSSGIKLLCAFVRQSYNKIVIIKMQF